MKDKILVHTDELEENGIELYSFKEVCDAPRIPHRDDHYMFMLQENGNSSWSIDFKDWVLESGSLCFVAPGQVHYFIKSNNEEGWLIFIKSELIPGEYRMLLDNCMYHHQVITINRDHPVFALIPALDQILREQQTVLFQSIIHSFVSALTGVFTSLFTGEHSQTSISLSSHKYKLVITFKELIQKQFREVKQVKDYASQLHITPLYLNEITKEVTGFTASYWIQKEILLESQKLLFYTNMDVKEIAFSLGYEDHTYFSRFFKKNIGVTAGIFRQNNHYLSNHNH